MALLFISYKVSILSSVMNFMKLYSCETVSPRNIRIFTHKISPRLPRHELSKDYTNGCAKLEREKPTRFQPYAKNYRQLSLAGSRRGFSQGRAQQVLQCQIGSSENIHTSTIMQTQQAIFVNIYVYIHI